MSGMTRTATKPRRLTVTIREERVQGFAPLAGGKSRVDREHGIIYGVKVVGRSSPNTHGVQGVEGTDYTREALESELPQIEGINVNVDHPPRQKPGQERSARDRFAWIQEARIDDDGIFGDLHFLDPSDPLAVKMMNAAESKPDAFALSHNAVGNGTVKNKRYVIQEVPEVRSVDIVADGGTNRSLFESRNMKKTMTRRAYIEKAIRESKSLTPIKCKQLLEMTKNCGEDMDEEGSVSAAGTMEADDEPTPHDHMTNAIGGLVKSDDPDDHDKASKILKLMRPAEEEDDSDDNDDSGGKKGKDVEEDDEGESQAGRGKPTKGKGEENTEDDSKGKENMESRQRRAKKRCELAGVNPTADLIESLAGVPSQTWDSLLIAVKNAGGASNQGSGKKGSSAPRSAAAGSVNVRESRGAPADGDKVKHWTGRLLSRN